MVRVYGVLYVIAFLMWLLCLIDAITTPGDRARNLPKIAWVVIVLLFPFVGSIAWLVAGRPRDEARPLQSWEREQPAFPEYDRPGRAAAADPEQDAAFLAELRKRAQAEEEKRVARAREHLEREKDA